MLRLTASLCTQDNPNSPRTAKRRARPCGRCAAPSPARKPRKLAPSPSDPTDQSDPTDRSAPLPAFAAPRSGRQRAAPFPPRRAPFTSLGVVLVPLPLAALSQEVFKVQQQLVQAGPRNVHQAQLRLAGGRRRPAALGNVLPTAARRLHHLIVGARTLIDKPVAERHCRIVNHRSHLKATQFAVAAARPQ